MLNRQSSVSLPIVSEANIENSMLQIEKRLSVNFKSKALIFLIRSSIVEAPAHSLSRKKGFHISKTYTTYDTILSYYCRSLLLNYILVEVSRSSTVPNWLQFYYHNDAVSMIRGGTIMTVSHYLSQRIQKGLKLQTQTLFLC